MLKGHPKGLISAALANMGERFGFYTMMAILTLFLMAKQSTNIRLIFWPVPVLLLKTQEE